MEDQNKLELAKRTFATLCEALDSQNWKYRRDDEKMTVEYTVQSEDVPMAFTFTCDAEHQLIRLVSPLPLEIAETARLDVSVAVSLINDKIVNGTFDYDIVRGRVQFRICNSFCDSVLSPQVFLYLLGVSIETVDAFNEKLVPVAAGVMSVERFIEVLNGVVD